MHYVTVSNVLYAITVCIPHILIYVSLHDVFNCTCGGHFGNNLNYQVFFLFDFIPFQV